MNDQNRPGDHRVYITDEARKTRTAPPRDTRAVPPRGGAAERDRLPNIVLLFSFVLFGILLITFITVFAITSGGRRAAADITTEPALSVLLPATEATEPQTGPATEPPQTTAPAVYSEPKTISGINSRYAALVDADSGELIAAKNADELMYPASLTKIMTLIVAREKIADLNSRVEFSKKMLYSLELDAMKVGYGVGESAAAIDLMYGAMLPSGCDAAVGLAYMCAEDEDAFAALMNEKAAELGLGRTHFANSSGLHDPNNYTTAHEMAKIFGYALGDELMREIICTDSYTTGGDGSDPATKHKLVDLLRQNIKRYAATYGAVTLSGFTMLGGKTGYVDESGSCLASYSVSGSGRRYIVVTGSARNMSEVLADHYNILMRYAK